MAYKSARGLPKNIRTYRIDALMNSGFIIQNGVGGVGEPAPPAPVGDDGVAAEEVGGVIVDE